MNRSPINIRRQPGLRNLARSCVLGSVIGVALLVSSCTTPPSGQSLLSALKLPNPLNSSRTVKPKPAWYFKSAETEIAANCYMVKTTAYSHKEADSKPYGRLSASGSPLRARGNLRSAAADWSRYPLGTKFRIIGSKQIYEVDDYGSALVGTDTIDIYQPTLTAMRNWGAPEVGVEVLEWGSMKRSMEILQTRLHVPHVKQMWKCLQAKRQVVPEELEDGFQVSDGSDLPSHHQA